MRRNIQSIYDITELDERESFILRVVGGKTRYVVRYASEEEEIRIRTSRGLAEIENIGGQGVCFLCGGLCTRNPLAVRQECFVCQRRQEQRVTADPSALLYPRAAGFLLAAAMRNGRSWKLEGLL